MREPVEVLFPRSSRVVYRVSVACVGGAVGRIYRVQVEGLDHLPAEGPVIVAANHNSFLDPISITWALRGPRGRRITYLAKAELFESKLSGWLFTAGGQIPVHREHPDVEEPMLAGMRVLAHGGVLGVHPEGSRSPDGRLYRGKTGVARLAAMSKTVVIPTGVTGTHAIFPKDRKLPKLRGRVSVRFGEPVRFPDVVGPDDTTMRSFVDDLMRRIQALTGQEYVDRYSSTFRMTDA